MKNLLVISDAHIILEDGKKAGYAPFVKELDLWMQNVAHTTIMCPHKIDKPLLTQELAIQDFDHIKVIRLEFHKWSHALRSTLLIPFHFVFLLYAMSIS